MLEGRKNIFIVGIGGIGVSGLARLLRARGVEVSGSDLEQSPITEALAREGIPVAVGHREENLPERAELLIYSAAVPDTNPERKMARDRSIPEMSYAEALGELLNQYELIAVAGTNGKTTTAAMVAEILQQAGLDPSALVGSIVKNWGSNVRIGKGKYFVLEADEYRRAFLHYDPTVAVITNIEADHLDYFKDLGDVKKAFLEFAMRIRPGGCLVYNAASSAAAEIAKEANGRKISFALRPPANITSLTVDLTKLQVPGEFNRENALAAAAAAQVLGVAKAHIDAGLRAFTGTWRRFERLGKVGNTEIISDYAHHPTGVKVTLEAAESVFGKKILAVFQPHQHNRTKKLLGEFVSAFGKSGVRDLIIPEIFEVRGREESADQDISSADLVKALTTAGKHAQYAANLDECEKMVKRVLPEYDAVIFMGAGDIYKVAERLANG